MLASDLEQYADEENSEKIEKLLELSVEHY